MVFNSSKYVVGMGGAHQIAVTKASNDQCQMRSKSNTDAVDVLGSCKSLHEISPRKLRQRPTTEQLKTIVLFAAQVDVSDVSIVVPIDDAKAIWSAEEVICSYSTLLTLSNVDHHFYCKIAIIRQKYKCTCKGYMQSRWQCSHVLAVMSLEDNLNIGILTTALHARRPSCRPKKTSRPWFVKKALLHIFRPRTWRTVLSRTSQAAPVAATTWGPEYQQWSYGVCPWRSDWIHEL